MGNVAKVTSRISKPKSNFFLFAIEGSLKKDGDNPLIGNFTSIKEIEKYLKEFPSSDEDDNESFPRDCSDTIIVYELVPRTKIKMSLVSEPIEADDF